MVKITQMKKTTLRQAAMKLALAALVLLAPAVSWGQTTLNEGFESTTFPPDDWTSIHVSGSQSWVRSTGTGASSSSAYAFRKDVSGGYNDYLITPKLVPQTGDELSFYLASQYAYNYANTTLTIEVSTTTPTVDAFNTVLATYNSGPSGNFGTTGESNWVNKTVDVSAYVGQEIYIAFHAVDAGYNADVRIDDVSGVSLYVPSCPKPSNPTATLTLGDGSVATLSWTKGGTEPNWVLEYSTASDFTGATQVTSGFITSDNNVSVDLTGLTPEQTYYARVKANCGGGDESDWSSETGISFTPTNTFSLSVNDGTATNEYVPFYGYYADATQQNQMIIPAADLAAMTDGEITQMVFYIDHYSLTSSIGNWIVSLGETSATTLDGLDNTTTLTEVYSGAMTFDNASAPTIMTVTFTDGYVYNGGNLLVQFNHPVAAGYSRYYFTGVTATGASYCYNSQRNFLPKTTFTYLPNPTPKPRNLAVSNIISSGATLTWEAPASATPTSYEYQFKTSTAEWPTDWTSNGTNFTVTFNTLTASNNYTFRVRAIYDGVGKSDPVETSFTTLDNCAFPTNLVATTTPGQGTKATLTWVKGYDEEAWVLEYATNADFTEGLVEVTEGFTVEGNNVTANLTGLTAETHYYARVKADCDGSTSSPSNVADFTPTNYKDFTFGQTASYTSNYVPFYGNYASSSPLLSQFIIPSTELEDMAGGTIRRMTFYSSTASASWGDAEFSVYVKEVEASSFASSDAAGLEDWSSMTNVYNGSLSISGNQMVIEFENNFAYNGGNLMIGFNETTTGTAASANWYYVSGPSYSTLYAYNGYYGASYSRGSSLPKVTFNYQPTATPRPIITEPVPTTDVTATVAWTKPSDNVTGYKYQYKLASATEWPTSWTELNDANAVSVTVPNLTPNTSYDFQIKAVYAEGESVASSTSFATTCPAATAVPYTYDFETAPKFNCWTVLSGNITRYSGTTHLGNYRLDFRGTTSNMIALPALAAPTNTLRIEFWTRPENSSVPDEYSDYSGKFAVGYMTNIEDASTFVAIETYNATDWASPLTYTKKVVDFDGTGVPANAYIAMRQFDCATNYYWYVDDVKVKVIPTCEDVNDVHYVSFTNHSATIAWTADAAQSAWQIAYKADANFDPYNAEELATATIVDVTSNPYLFDKNLEAATTYYMYVRGNCTASSNGYGDWSDSYATFTTLAATPTPSNFVASNPASAKVDLVWNAGGGDYELSWDLYYVQSDDAPEAPTATTEATKTVTPLPTTENPYTLENLAEESRYYIWVRANHGADGNSGWVALTDDFFTTLPSCPTPTALAATNITNNAATIRWTGSSDVESYTVQYRTAKDLIGIAEEFGTSIPAGWSMYTGLLNSDDGTATMTVATYGWSFGTNNGVFDNHARVNIYGNYQRWLVTPEMIVPENGVLNFDMALTAFSGSSVPAPSTTGTDDKFIVLVTTDNMDTWNILRKWDNEGSVYVYNNIANTATGENVNIDLSGYAGASVKIAFYGESTESNADNNLHIDNVAIGTAVPVGEWQTATSNVAEESFTIEGLEAETKYDVQVKSNCTNGEYSAPYTFTTASVFTKSIQANKWYAIATPAHDCVKTNKAVAVANVRNLTTAANDLYSYDEANGSWMAESDSLMRGTGYIYRSAAPAELGFVGYANTGSVSVSLTYSCPDNDLKGFNLIGNPYPHTVAVSRDFYTLEPEGTWMAKTSGDTITAAEACLVRRTTYYSTTYTFNDEIPNTSSMSNSNTALAFTVSNDEFEDVAYARFDNGEGLPKIGHLNSEAPMLSIPVEGRRYAIANLGSDCQSFNLVFRGVNGTYTIKQSSNQAIAYCHLIDRVAGKEIDMLRQPSYTFSSNGFDADRFMVKLSPDAQENANGNFAYWNGNSWMVEGNGTLQVFDALGRQLFSQEISNSNFEIQNSLFPAAGVYVLRMGEKTQKIVVR